MAKGKKNSRSVSVDMTGVQAFSLVPEGDYVVRVAELTKETSESSGNDYLAWTFEITDGKLKGQKLFYNTSLMPKALWNLRGVLEAFGHEVPDSKMDLDLDEIQSSDATAGVSVEHEVYEGKKKPRVVDVFSSENVSGDESGDESGDKDNGDSVSRDDIMAMDEDELKEFIDEHDLDVDLDDHKKLKAKREAVAEAFEAKDDKGSDDADKDSGSDFPDEDAINEMDEDELAELNEEHELGVDLDDHKKLKAKRQAIIEAIEAKKGGGDEEESGDKVSEEDIEAMGKDELKEFIKEHSLKVELEGSTSKQRRAVIKAAKKAGLIEE